MDTEELRKLEKSLDFTREVIESRKLHHACHIADCCCAMIRPPQKSLDFYRQASRDIPRSHSIQSALRALANDRRPAPWSIYAHEPVRDPVAEARELLARYEIN